MDTFVSTLKTESEGNGHLVVFTELNMEQSEEFRRKLTDLHVKGTSFMFH